MLKNILRVVPLVLICLTSRVHAEATRGFDDVVIDGVRIPFGAIVEVSGPWRDRDSDQLGGGATTLRLLRLDGKANQDNFEVHLNPSDTDKALSYEKLSALDHGKSYKARGRLVSARVMGPYRALGVQVDRVEPMPPSPLGFADFVDRAATFDGTAGAQGQLQTEEGAALVEGVTAWPQSVEGKKITVRGVIRRANGGWRIERPSWHRVELAEQLGQDVSLEGTLWSSNGKWWFGYRGDDLYLTTASSPIMRFPGDDHGRQARVTGRLVRQDRPSIKEIDYGFGAALVPCFVVRGAKVEYLEGPADWVARFGPIYDSIHTVRDGVIELLPESSLRKNIIGSETVARLYLERNADAVDSILRRATPETREVLAQRMEDSKRPEPLRLLYAGMLLWLDDVRGRSFLLSRAEPNGPPSVDALYCLGAFLSSTPAKDIEWAEQPLIALMKGKTLAHPERSGLFSKDPETLRVFGMDVRTFTVADATARFSEIPSVLLRMKSAPARQAVIDYLVTKDKNSARSGIIGSLRLFDETERVDAGGAVDVAAWHRNARSGSVLLPVDDLLKLEAVTEDRYDRIAILSQLLRHKHRAAVEEFLEDLKDSFTYMEIRDHSSPEVIALLRTRIPALTGLARAHAEMLVVLAEKDPIPTLMGRLDDAKRVDKDLIMYELSRFTGPRTVVPLARLLRTAPPGFFDVDDQRIADEAAKFGAEAGVDAKYAKSVREIVAGSAVKHALEAIAHAKTPEAIPALIELLPVDLARFGTYIDREGFRRGIAAHLIDLTGESFGVNVDAWRDWRRTHPEAGLTPSN